MRFTDAAKVSGTRMTADGFLVAEAFVARTGIQLYAGSEVGVNDKKVVRVYRSEDEVKKIDSVRSYSHAPVTIGHPSEPVTADNWKDLAVGEVSTEVEWRDGKIRVPLVLKDSRAIDKLGPNLSEISMGYTCDLDFTPGKTPDGQEYDAQQKNIVINHLAIVPKGRAGSECRIGDEADNWGAAPRTTIDNKEKPMSMKTVVMGDRAVQVAADDASTVENFLRQLQADHDAKIAKMQADHDKAMGVKDAELETVKGELTATNAKVLSDAQISERAEARARLIADAETLAPGLDVKALSDADLRRAVLAKRLGDARVEGKSDDYVLGVFESLVTAAPKMTGDRAAAPIHKPLVPGQKTVDAANDPTFGQVAFVNNMMDAWMNPGSARKEG